MADGLQRVILSHVRAQDLDEYKCICDRLTQWNATPELSIHDAQGGRVEETLPYVNAVHPIQTSFLLDIRHPVTADDVDFPDDDAPRKARTWAYFNPEKSVIAAIYKNKSLSAPDIWALLCRESGTPMGQQQPFPVILRPDSVLSAAAKAQNSLFSSFLSEIVLPPKLAEKYDINLSTLTDLGYMKPQPVVLSEEFFAGYKPRFGQKMRAWANRADSTTELKKASQNSCALSPIAACNELMEKMVFHSIRADLNNPVEVGSAMRELINQNA